MFVRSSLIYILSLYVLSATAANQPYTNILAMQFVPVPEGEFIMGTQDITAALFELPSGDSAQIKDETPAHRVFIDKPILMGRTEVTQQQWLTVMGTKPGPDSHWQRDDWQQLPVVGVSWYRVQDFIEKLNQQDKNAQYRLPTEAEWEYAARAGSQGLRPFERDGLSQHAWYLENSGDTVQPVATKLANAWGLHDMFGNAWEWVADRYAADYYQRSPKVSPTGPTQGERRVRRGGSYHCEAHLVRSAYRAVDLPQRRYSVLGFRLIAEPIRPN